VSPATGALGAVQEEGYLRLGSAATSAHGVPHIGPQKEKDPAVSDRVSEAVALSCVWSRCAAAGA
jgi:hypothetical protein